MGCVCRRNKTYWIKYYRHGKQYAESTNSDKVAVAKRLLKAKEGEIAEGKIPRVCFDRIRFEEIISDYLSDYRVNGKKTVKKAEQCATLLLKEFNRKEKKRKCCQCHN
ncbi:MAG TPA: hypothetical protein PLM47_06345 [Smithellaceae bacterium]|nr:hypothetical protein [Smithellaceae bacterium]HOS09421.1 hypothetical protein [Smithellaceae bacterium]HPD49754.1 hypothetical protein [Smithellaceae bacterium]HPL49918.1 hypothetical protein [Smithellaceae bacterium]HRT36630.1 hypothetical protein [Smithellaceae bacterium]